MAPIRGDSEGPRVGRRGRNKWRFIQLHGRELGERMSRRRKGGRGETGTGRDEGRAPAEGHKGREKTGPGAYGGDEMVERPVLLALFFVTNIFQGVKHGKTGTLPFPSEKSRRPYPLVYGCLWLSDATRVVDLDHLVKNYLQNFVTLRDAWPETCYKYSSYIAFNRRWT